MYNLNNFKNHLHGLIIKIGNQIYDERIANGQTGAINESKIKLSNSKRYENNARIEFKLKLLRDRYDCENEYLKYRYTEMYYKRKKRLKELIDEGLPMMVIFLMQKLDYELQMECKNFKDQLRNDMGEDFKILLKCVLEHKSNDLTKLIEEQVEELFQKDLNTVYKMWIYCLRNIEVHVKSTICENFVKSIHILCSESSYSRVKKWERKKENSIKISQIKKYINDIKRWKPKLAVCSNVEIWRKHFKTILKKFEKYFNFYHLTRDKLSFCEIDENTNIIDDQSSSEYNLDATPSTIFAAFENNGTYCCKDESKIFIAGQTNVIPIRNICEHQTARLRKNELDNLKNMAPADQISVHWSLCDSYPEDRSNESIVRSNDGKIKRDSVDMPNLITDLLQMIDTKKLTTLILNELSRSDSSLKPDITSQKYVQLHKQVYVLLQHEIEHKLNNNEVLSKLNETLGPAYEAVRLKRISALSYIKDSMTILRNKNSEPESITIRAQEKPIESVPVTYPKSIKMTNQEYLDSFIKLPPYMYPMRPQPPFESIYKKASQTECTDSMTHEINDEFEANYFLFHNQKHLPEFERTKHRKTSILKQNPRGKLEPYYNMTIRTIINKIEEHTQKC